MSSSHSLRMELQMLLNDFYSITQVNVSYLPLPAKKKYTLPLRPIATAASTTDFLSHLYHIPDFKERGAQMALDALNRVSTHTEGHTQYHPFPGLTVFVLPVLARGVLLGCLLYGPVRDVRLSSQHQVSTLYRHHNLAPDAMQLLYDKLPACEDAALLASSRLLSQIVVYANSIDSPALQSPPLSTRIAEYIDTQYMNPISPGTACEAFHISRTTLSRTLSKEFSTTFLALLNRRRIQNVCKCLEDGLSPEEASNQSGFSSPSYMVRLFRAMMGCTPHVYQAVAAEQAHHTRNVDNNSGF